MVPLLLTISHIFLPFHRMSNFGLYAGHDENYSTQTILSWKYWCFVLWSHFLYQQNYRLSYLLCVVSQISIKFLKTYLQSIISLSWSSWLQEWARDLAWVFKIQNSAPFLAVSFLEFQWMERQVFYFSKVLPSPKIVLSARHFIIYVQIIFTLWSFFFNF